MCSYLLQILLVYLWTVLVVTFYSLSSCCLMIWCKIIYCHHILRHSKHTGFDQFLKNRKLKSYKCMVNMLCDTCWYLFPLVKNEVICLGLYIRHILSYIQYTLSLLHVSPQNKENYTCAYLLIQVAFYKLPQTFFLSTDILKLIDINFRFLRWKTLKFQLSTKCAVSSLTQTDFHICNSIISFCSQQC